MGWTVKASLHAPVVNWWEFLRFIYWISRHLKTGRTRFLITCKSKSFFFLFLFYTISGPSFSSSYLPTLSNIFSLFLFNKLYFLRMYLFSLWFYCLLATTNQYWEISSTTSPKNSACVLWEMNRTACRQFSFKKRVDYCRIAISTIAGDGNF